MEIINKYETEYRVTVIDPTAFPPRTYCCIVKAKKIVTTETDINNSFKKINIIDSRYYKEKIDNIMYAGNIKIIQSGPCAASPWSLAKDYPMAYKIYSGTGYSDHLPVMIKFILCTSDKI